MWLVINIGCIECGVSSNVVGLFDSEVKAADIAAKCNAVYSWREDGENRFEVFPLPPANQIHSEYPLAADPTPNQESPQ